MTISRAHARMKNLADLTARLASASSFRRWVSVESGKQEEFPDELCKGMKFAAVWGNGDYGRLGLGNLQSQWRPKPVSPTAFGNQSLKEIACGGAHTLFLTENGVVYTTGLNDFGQLGLSNSHDYTTMPLRVSGIPKEVIKISAGYYHSAAITVNGELYTWGKNANGQLGLGKKAEKIVSLPHKVEYLDGVTIQTTSLGFEHSIAVTDKGEVLSWGGGESGRLGHGHESSILGFQISGSEYTPRLIKGLEGIKVKSVSTGMLHSACISENGSVYFFGEKELGKWGFGKVKSATTPSTISVLPFSEEVACGGYHTCVITSGGELYTWGSNENGCLGIGCTDITYSPERVEGPFLKQNVCKVSCGWKHTAAVSGGNVYTWGWGGSNGTFKEDGHSPGGQLFLVTKRYVKLVRKNVLRSEGRSVIHSEAAPSIQGLGDDADYIEPTLVDLGKNVKALQVSCGFNHTAAIFECL